MGTPISYEVRVRQWFHAALTEREGQALVGHIEGTKKLYFLVPYTALPETAQVIIRTEYDKTQLIAGKEPLCSVCGHPRSEHSEEMPYECMHCDMCDCDGFSYSTSVLLTSRDDIAII